MSTLNVKDSSGNWKEIPSIGGYTKDEVNSMLAKKANLEHTHLISEVNSLQSVLDSSMKTYTKLLDTTSSGLAGTTTLSDSILNYKMILILLQYGGNHALMPILCPSKFISERFYSATTRIVIATDTLYCAVYFPSATSFTLYNSNLGSQSNKKFLIYGIN